jgi:hypothetical protein
MFYDLTLSQVRKIKDKFYPKELVVGDFLKAVVVNNYGSDNPDTSVRIVLSIKDGVERTATGEQIFKIFNNETAKKYLKMKLFEISNKQMLSELRGFEEIEQIERVIQKYGALSRDYSPSLEFAGNKTNIDGHIRLLKPPDAIELTYDTTFLLPRWDSNFLSLGLIFYFDKQKYIEAQNIDKNFIDQRILVDNLLVYNLYDGGVPVSANISVQDLRFSGSIFKSQKILRRIEQINLSKALKSRLNKTKKKYFSNCYLSRNFDNSAGLSFTIDYESILKDNSIYSELFERSGLKDELISKCKITNLKIKRRGTKKYGQNKYIHSPETQIDIISSGESKTSPSVVEVDDESGFLSEINLNTGPNTYYRRSFVAKDKKIFADSTGLQQYGAEITISDGINEFLKDYADSLAIHISRLKEYSEETNKIAKISEDGTYQFSIRGSYDPQKNAFTPQFLNNYNLPRGNQPSYRDIVIDAAANFVATLSLLGLENQNNDSLKRSVGLMLHPLSTDAETIIYFISIFQTVINEIYRLIEENFNNTYTVQTWFTNDFIDASQPIKVGYKYFDQSNYRGLASIRSLDYSNRVTSEIDRFSTRGSITLDTTGSKSLAYLSPNFVFTKNTVLPLLNLTPEADSITNYDFIKAEKDIKSGVLSELSAKVDTPLMYFRELMSLALTKQYNPTAKTYTQEVVNTAIVSPVTVNPNFIAKDTIEQTSVPTSPTIPTAPVVQQQIAESDQVPQQINTLLEDKCRLLKESDNYRSSLEYLSKYNLLFNTIQAVEVLEYKNDTLDEKWTLITIDKLQNLVMENIFLCRLREYKNSNFGVAGMDEIRLPIYNQHFLLSNSIFTISLPPRILDSLARIIDVVRGDFVVQSNDMFDRFPSTNLLDQLNLGTTPEENLVVTAPVLSSTDILSPLPEIAFTNPLQTIYEPVIPTFLSPEVAFSQPLYPVPLAEPILSEPQQILPTEATFIPVIQTTQPTIPNLDLVSSTTTLEQSLITSTSLLTTQTTLKEPVLTSPTISKTTLQTTQFTSPTKLTRPF